MFRCQKCGKLSRPGETSKMEVVERHPNGDVKKEIRVHSVCPQDDKS